MVDEKLVSQLFNELVKIPCINSHCHLPPEKERLMNIPDALAFLKHEYPASDLSSAGMSNEDIEKAFNSGFPIKKRWELLRPYWPYIRMTGYAQSILIGFKDLFGFSELNEDTIGPISDAVFKHSVPGYYHKILRDKCNIKMSVKQIKNDILEVDRTLFIPMPRLNRLSMIEKRSQIKEIENLYQVNIESLQDLVSAIESVCETWKREKVAGVKLSQSYFRRMDFKLRDENDASAVFNNILKGEEVELNSEKGKLLGDFLVFECCRVASEMDLTIQFHLGLRSGIYNSLEGCSPSPMVKLLKTFPKARFDLSHSGYPYLHESAVLAKGWSNIFLNTDWIQIVSPEGCKKALHEWLRMVPYNKIIAYGDDVEHIEVVYGSLVIARRNVAAVLAELIQEGSITESDALDIAQAMFHDTPAKLYKIN